MFKGTWNIRENKQKKNRGETASKNSSVSGQRCVLECVCCSYNKAGESEKPLTYLKTKKSLLWIKYFLLAIKFKVIKLKIKMASRNIKEMHSLQSQKHRSVVHQIQNLHLFTPSKIILGRTVFGQRNSIRSHFVQNHHRFLESYSGFWS